MEVKPTYFPSVPRIFEKIYTLANANAEDPELLKKAIQVGLKVRQMQERGEQVPAELQQHFDQAEEKLFAERPQPVRRPDPPVRDGRRADRAARSSSSSTPAASR